MSFTDAEIAYIRSQPLVRISTVSPDGQPDAAPVGFEFDGEHFHIGGVNLASTRKARNIENGQRKVALIIDDLVSLDPWTPRFLRVYGTAELVERTGSMGFTEYIRVTPTTSWSWNLDGHPITGADDALQARVQRTAHRSARQPAGK